ncbi:hypothetical protein Bpfe_015809 [Biomphalaria pfeifferi]|uniref:Uncharacterized protein n=1 Tax=Biomphalaria pfeifferi TaxID=112525 RepID=A0AAD8BIF1_BIOPF|nr:hypothetical protein Bpfe_015809 [Biomphalaria pfeifferi]
MQEEHRKKASAQSSITKIPDSSNSESEENIEEQQQHKDKDYEIEIPLYYKKQLCYAVDVEESSELDIATKKPRILQDMLSSSDVASALDRINLSDRKFTIVAAAIEQASGQSLDDAALSCSTVHRKRLTHRSVIESLVQEQFLACDKTPLLVHWDSKIMMDTTNNTDPHSNTDRVAVVVTAALLSIGLDVALLNGIDPENWSDCPHFQQAANVVKCLKVVNDTAERSIALMTSFNQSITKSEAEMQKLIQVIKDNQERIPDSSKASLASAKTATK